MAWRIACFVAAMGWLGIQTYTALRRDAMAAERWNILHPEQEPRVPYVKQALGDAPAPVGPYNQAVRVGETLWCSGQIALEGEYGLCAPLGVPFVLFAIGIDKLYGALAWFRRNLKREQAQWRARVVDLSHVKCFLFGVMGYFSQANAERLQKKLVYEAVF